MCLNGLTKDGKNAAIGASIAHGVMVVLRSLRD